MKINICWILTGEPVKTSWISLWAQKINSLGFGLWVLCKTNRLYSWENIVKIPRDPLIVDVGAGIAPNTINFLYVCDCFAVFIFICFRHFLITQAYLAHIFIEFKRAYIWVKFFRKPNSPPSWVVILGNKWYQSRSLCL